MMVIEGGVVFFGALQNPCPNILVLDVLEVLDAMAALMLEELAALHWDTVNQVRTATEISRFALGQVDPTAAFHRTGWNDDLAMRRYRISHLLPSGQDLRAYLLMTSATARLPSTIRSHDHVTQAMRQVTQHFQS